MKFFKKNPSNIPRFLRLKGNYLNVTELTSHFSRSIINEKSSNHSSCIKKTLCDSTRSRSRLVPLNRWLEYVCKRYMDEVGSHVILDQYERLRADLDSLFLSLSCLFPAKSLGVIFTHYIRSKDAHEKGGVKGIARYMKREEKRVSGEREAGR